MMRIGDGRWMLFARLTVAAVALTAVASKAGAQIVGDSEPKAPMIEDAEKRIVEPREELFLLNRVPTLRCMNNALDRVDEISPLKFGAQANFLSNWLDEGANAAKHGLQIQQVYFTEYQYSFGPFSTGAGFEYFQIDTTGGVEGQSTLERDFTVYAPLSWSILSVRPLWTYIRYFDGEEEEDTGEIGAEVGLDLPLNPTFLWNYDYDKGKGSYFEWGISQGLPICWCGEKIAVFTPSMALGMNSHKYIDETVLTHIDWGLDLSIPLNHHFTMTGLLHFTKSLTHLKDEEGTRLFENIIPWAGLSLTMEF